MCIILYVLGVSMLTLYTYIHSVQKPAASQPLPLAMEQPGDKRARSAWPTANPSQWQLRVGPRARFKLKTLIVSEFFLEIS
jgi:hypothetical protein